MNKILTLAVLALGAISCTETQNEVTPLVDVTFNVEQEIIEIDTETSVAGRVETTVPDEVGSYFYFHMYDLVNSNYITGQTLYSDVDSVFVPQVEAKNYNITFDTWGGGANSINPQGVPLYEYKQTLNIQNNTNYDVTMVNKSGRIKTSMKEGQTLESKYNYYIITYSAKTYYYSDYTKEEYIYYGTQYDYYQENSLLRSNEYGSLHYFLPNEFKINSIKLYDTNGSLVKEVEVDVNFTLAVGQEINLIVDVDALCNPCVGCSEGHFLINWEESTWTTDNVIVN